MLTAFWETKDPHLLKLQPQRLIGILSDTGSRQAFEFCSVTFENAKHKQFRKTWPVLKPYLFLELVISTTLLKFMLVSFNGGNFEQAVNFFL